MTVRSSTAAHTLVNLAAGAAQAHGVTRHHLVTDRAEAAFLIQVLAIPAAATVSRMIVQLMLIEGDVTAYARDALSMRPTSCLVFLQTHQHPKLHHREQC